MAGMPLVHLKTRNEMLVFVADEARNLPSYPTLKHARFLAHGTGCWAPACEVESLL